MESTMNRRAFIGRGTLYLVGTTGVAALASGCGIGDIATFAPIGAEAFAAILALLGDPGTSVLVLAIKAAFSDIPADVKAYQAAMSTTTLQKIDEVLSLLLSNFQEFLAQLSVTNPIANLIASFSGIILAAVSGFIQKFFPQLAQVKKALQRKPAIGGVLIVKYTPKEMSGYEFKREWNENAELNNVPSARLHIGIFEHITRR